MTSDFNFNSLFLLNGPEIDTVDEINNCTRKINNFTVREKTEEIEISILSPTLFILYFEDIMNRTVSYQSI